MPLIHSSSKSALKTNIGTLMGEVGKSRHVQSRSQALAIAFAERRRAKRAMGGNAIQLPHGAHGMNMHTGPIMSAVPGRTDRHNMNVPSGAYVFPSDFVSHIGQNNTQAGYSILSRLFPSHPTDGIAASGGHRSSASDKGGGRGASVGQAVPVVTAGGEYVASPQAVLRRVGTNSLSHAHKVLDKWVLDIRKQHIKTLKKLPGPAKS